MAIPCATKEGNLCVPLELRIQECQTSLECVNDDNQLKAHRLRTMTKGEKRLYRQLTKDMKKSKEEEDDALLRQMRGETPTAPKKGGSYGGRGIGSFGGRGFGSFGGSGKPSKRKRERSPNSPKPDQDKPQRKNITDNAICYGKYKK